VASLTIFSFIIFQELLLIKKIELI